VIIFSILCILCFFISFFFFFFFFTAMATTVIYTLSLHDALPIFVVLIIVVAHRAMLFNEGSLLYISMVGYHWKWSFFHSSHKRTSVICLTSSKRCIGVQRIKANDRCA